MDPKDIKLKTGYGLDIDSDDEEQQHFIATTMGLMQVFSEEALKTAAEYVIGSGRKNVTDDDILKGLKFQARMFFQRVDDLEGRVEDAAKELWENVCSDDSDAGSQSDEYDSDSESMQSDDADGSDSSDSSDSDMEFDADEEEQCKRIVPQVNAIVKSWDKYEPTDPVLIFIKNAIDKTDAN
ncbi:hypothetical protein EhV011 [Emiliania huxleyi virus 86]|uniref:Uncharacterized protein n=1 Tax=Emiliania huxleyi virus 86 (isolate United Kingdom/English Channel/1999) TaxID=654925 RepID=Q4A3C2_EHV8U|nr:hypothetical protein EhV011 [Emiliania huxleyi virus 86]AEO97822.1 hypothetical protein ENVG_00124 [Emiliania huxleyi virus 84]AEP14947.1 hypothetical protein EOVG_00010 [Emiliania huxleyi virus 88]AHA54567.1 hypothetical protein EhV145_00013 [Emiliania huxleyi virus 145]AHA55606.1 hypothetical protein EhV164_00013 [Emiliania huxleyi virus 164]CAI65434.1 hypothetical protein EhV011 [Emiliania huxleyi virus 86]